MQHSEVFDGNQDVREEGLVGGGGSLISNDTDTPFN